MREILFRGKRKDTGEWVEGHLHKMDGYGTGYTEYGIQVQVISTSRPWSVLVLPETVGQYTGLTDKNGTKIFEGDIVNIEYPDTFVMDATIAYVGVSFYGDTDNDLWELDGYVSLEVIGNIHDKPELLKGE